MSKRPWLRLPAGATRDNEESGESPRERAESAGSDDATEAISTGGTR